MREDRSAAPAEARYCGADAWPAFATALASLSGALEDANRFGIRRYCGGKIAAEHPENAEVLEERRRKQRAALVPRCLERFLIPLLAYLTEKRLLSLDAGQHQEQGISVCG